MFTKMGRQHSIHMKSLLVRRHLSKSLTVSGLRPSVGGLAADGKESVSAFFE